MRTYRFLITVIALLTFITGCKEKQNNIRTFTPTTDPTPTVEVSVDPASVASTEDSINDSVETTAKPTVAPMPTETGPLHSMDPTQAINTEISTDNKTEEITEPTVTPAPTETENPHDEYGNANLSGESPED